MATHPTLSEYNKYDFKLEKLLVAHRYTLLKDKTIKYAGARNCFGFVYTINGSAEFIFSNKQKLTVEQGTILYLNSKTSYTVYAMEDFEHYTVNFLMTPEGNCPSKTIFSNDFLYLKNTNSALLASMLNDLSTQWAQRPPFYKISTKSGLYNLLFYFCQQYFHSNISFDSQRISHAVEYMKQNLTSKITLSQLAKMCNLSPSYFRSIFTKNLEMSPFEYLNQLRLSYAKSLLKMGIYSISEVAYQCGFDDPNYFSRFFKKNTGISPKEYL